MTAENAAEISREMLAALAASFAAKPERCALRNAVAKVGLNAAAYNRDALLRTQHQFSHDVKTGKATNQKKSGRCWLFAGLNVLRHAVAEKYGLEDFELSQTYLMFWDKLEKAGVRPEWLQLEWISAAEGQKFAKVMFQMEELRKTVTAEEIAHTIEALKPKPKKKAKEAAAAQAEA